MANRVASSTDAANSTYTTWIANEGLPPMQDGDIILDTLTAAQGEIWYNNISTTFSTARWNPTIWIDSTSGVNVIGFTNNGTPWERGMFTFRPLRGQIVLDHNATTSSGAPALQIKDLYNVTIDGECNTYPGLRNPTSVFLTGTFGIWIKRPDYTTANFMGVEITNENSSGGNFVVRGVEMQDGYAGVRIGLGGGNDFEEFNSLTVERCYSHDRIDGESIYFGYTGTERAGSHTGSDGASTLTDSTQSLTTDILVGQTIFNRTDGSSGTVTANTATTITATLAGGTDNDWDTGDKWFTSAGHPTFRELRIRDNVLVRSGREGIQLQHQIPVTGSIEIHNNVVIAGVNWIDDAGFQDNSSQMQFGNGPVRVHSNIFDGAGDNNMYLTSTPAAPLSVSDKVLFFNNLYINGKNRGLYLDNDLIEGVRWDFVKNWFVKYTNDYTDKPSITATTYVHAKESGVRDEINYIQNTHDNTKSIFFQGYVNTGSAEREGYSDNSVIGKGIDNTTSQPGYTQAGIDYTLFKGTFADSWDDDNTNFITWAAGEIVVVYTATVGARFYKAAAHTSTASSNPVTDTSDWTHLTWDESGVRSDEGGWASGDTQSNYPPDNFKLAATDDWALLNMGLSFNEPQTAYSYFRWYTADDAAGTNKVQLNEHRYGSLDINDSRNEYLKYRYGKYLVASVTPVNTNPDTGSETFATGVKLPAYANTIYLNFKTFGASVTPGAWTNTDKDPSTTGSISADLIDMTGNASGISATVSDAFRTFETHGDTTTTTQDFPPNSFDRGWQVLRDNTPVADHLTGTVTFAGFTANTQVRVTAAFQYEATFPSTNFKFEIVGGTTENVLLSNGTAAQQATLVGTADGSGNLDVTISVDGLSPVSSATMEAIIIDYN